MRDHEVIPMDLLLAIDHFQSDVHMSEVVSRETQRGAQDRVEGQRRVLTLTMIVSGARRWVETFNRFSDKPILMWEAVREMAEDEGKGVIDSRLPPSGSESGDQPSQIS